MGEVEVTLTGASASMEYSIGPAEVLIGGGVAKSYDGYRMLWKPEEGFVAIFQGKDQRNSAKPESGLITEFRNDLIREAADNVELGAYLGKFPRVKTDNKSTSWDAAMKMPQDKFGPGRRSISDLPFPAAFHKPIVVAPSSDPRKLPR